MMADTLSFTAKVDMVQGAKVDMVSGIVHHKSDRKSCVLPTADPNTSPFLIPGRAIPIIKNKEGAYRGLNTWATGPHSPLFESNYHMRKWW